MQYLILSGIILFSLLIAFQDFKSRSVSILYLAGFTLVSVLYGIYQFQWQQMLWWFLFNIGFLVFQGAVLSLYYFIKYRNFKLLSNSLGGADIWIIVALSFSFDFVGFIVFVCLGFIISIGYYVVMNNVLKKYIKEIPLAGIITMFYMIYVVARLFFS
jgi:hypothetical protein